MPRRILGEPFFFDPRVGIDFRMRDSDDRTVGRFLVAREALETLSGMTVGPPYAVLLTLFQHHRDHIETVAALYYQANCNIVLTGAMLGA